MTRLAHRARMGRLLLLVLALCAPLASAAPSCAPAGVVCHDASLTPQSDGARADADAVVLLLLDAEGAAAANATNASATARGDSPAGAGWARASLDAAGVACAGAYAAGAGVAHSCVDQAPSVSTDPNAWLDLVSRTVQPTLDRVPCTPRLGCL